LIVSLGIHEAAHAWSAYKLGDSTAKDLGRMTLNPIVHIDLFMTILLPLMCYFVGAPLFGGAKPVPVNFNRLRNPWADMAVVAFAGPLSNFLLAILFWALWKFFVLYGYYNGAAELADLRQFDLLPKILQAAMATNVVLFVFNLIPIPPLDGSRIVVNLLPISLRESYMAIGTYGLFIILALLNYVPAFNQLVYGDVMPKVIRLVKSIASLGGHW
jgi:Zn-dependent protease